MREFKFRAWDKWRNEMIAPNGGDFIGWHGPSNWGKCFEVMQYTGLKDSAGTEIYEGDVLQVAGYGKMIIDWPFDLLYEYHGESDIGAILGNIYQHPELLK